LQAAIACAVGGQFEAAIRTDGKSVEANLRGFRAVTRPRAPGWRRSNCRPEEARADERGTARAGGAALPLPAQPTALEGVRRLIAYQSAAYARLYLDRLRAVANADQVANAQGKLLKEVARHLAVRMSYEDVVRVAQAKIAPSRMQRIARRNCA